MEGYGCYNGLTYLYAGHIGGTALATASVYDWVFTPDSDAEDSGIKTFTIEQGQTARAHRALYGMVNTVDVEFTRAECKVSGDLFAQRISDGISMAASPTVIDAVPILAGQLSVYLDDTAAGLGTTKLLRPLEVKVSSATKFEPIWPLNSALDSFATHVEKKGVHEIELTLEADGTAGGLYSTMRNAATKFLRLEALGGTITGTARYTYRADYAVQVSEMPDMKVLQELQVATWKFNVVHDDTWGKSQQITLRNNLSAL